MARHSRHYHAARKEIKTKPIPSNGMFVKKEDKSKIIAIAIVVMILVFIKGMLLGYFLSNETE